MITLITGENTFENERAVQKITAAFDGTSEKVDGSTLELRQLPDLLMGATLFASKRLVIIKNLSENKAVWAALTDWAARISDDIHLVLVETKPDKRTKTYKDLQKIADIRESKLWTERDAAKAEQWVTEEAQRLGFELDKKSAHALVERAGMDQWLLFSALEKLSVLDIVSSQIIEELIEGNPLENVFAVFETALKGDAVKVSRILAILELSEDPYRLFGLLSGQAFQLAALSLADGRPSAEVAKDIGVHPFALSKMAPYARQLGQPGVKKVITAFAQADAGMKTSAAEPWLLIERALVKVAQI